MTRSRLAALLALALPLAAACTAPETAPAVVDTATGMPQEAAMATPAPEPTRSPAAGQPVQAPAASEPERDSCGAAKVRARWTGALPTAEVKAEIAATVGERRIRYYTEGDPITMDYSEDRLNVVLGRNGRIAEFRCG